MSNDSENPVQVECPVAFQGVTLWLGDGAPCTVEDAHARRDVRDWVSLPMQRRVMAARLRLIAEWLDEDPLADMMESAAAEVPA